MNRLRRKIAKIMTFVMLVSLGSQFGIGSADGRLTEFKDSLSRIKRSGAGAATQGYLESNANIRSKFVFHHATNEEICVDRNLAGTVDGTCTGSDNILVDLIDDSAIVADIAYSGTQVAGYIAEALETGIRDHTTVDAESFTGIYNDSAVNSFTFELGVNENIRVSLDGTGPGDATLSLLTDGHLVAHQAYSGAEVAAALQHALGALDLSTGDDTYTVTYNTDTEAFTITATAGTNGVFIDFNDALSTAALYLGFTADADLIFGGTAAASSDVPADYINRFQIRANGGNTYDPIITWDVAATTAEGTLGFSNGAASPTLRSNVDVSDNQMQFNVIALVNDQFALDLNGQSTNGTETITVTPGNYTGISLAAQLTTDINTGWQVGGKTGAVLAQYGVSTLERFRITSTASGSESYVHMVSAVRDFLPTVDLVNNIPKDGMATAVIVASDHTLSFKTKGAVPPAGEVIITFPVGFTFPVGLSYTDIDFATGATLAGVTERTLAATHTGTSVGVAVDETNRVLTFQVGSDAGQGIDAATYVQIKVGRNTAYQTTGLLQITNPAIPGMYQVQAETRTSDELTFTNTVNDQFIWDPDGANKFVFAVGVNNLICLDTAGDGLDNANCTTDDDSLTDLIVQGGLVAGTEYTGADVATAIATALAADNANTDTYTVSYNATTQKFSIQPLVGTTDINIFWSAAVSTASRVLGFTADKTDLYTSGIWTSDIISGTYVLDMITDGGLVSGTANAGAAVATALKTALELAKFPNGTVDNVFNVTYTAGTGKFTIANNTVDEYPAIYWSWDTSTAAYTLGYLSDDTTASTTFSYISDISSPIKPIDTAFTAIYIVANDQITISAGVDPNLAMEINGGLAFSSVEGDRDTLGLDFGALEPNAYYKLGGAKTEYGKIEVQMNCGPGLNEACIPSTNDTITIRGVTYTFKRVAADAATNGSFVYASVTGTTQQQRAAKLLTNLYRAINSTDVNVRANISRSSNTTLWVLSTREGADAAFALIDGTTNTMPSDLTLTEYNGVNSYFYKDNKAKFNTDPTTYQTDLAGVSDFRGHNIKINTNAADGYTLQIRDQGPDDTSPFRTWSDSVDLGFGLFAYSQSTRWGVEGNKAEGDDLIQEAFQGGEDNNFDPQGLTTAYQTVARDDVSTARDNISLEYVVRVDADQPAGNYQTTLDLMLSAQY